MHKVYRTKPFYLLAVIILLFSIIIFACNTKDGTRFLEQEELYIFEASSMRLVAHGATRIEDASQTAFRCPSSSGMGRDSDVSVFYAQAQSPSPHFELTANFGVRSDIAPTLGVSLSQLPMGVLDLYEVCDAVSSEKYLTHCPPNYKIVAQCTKNSLQSCALIQEGSHELRVRAKVLAEKACYTEESDRSEYDSSAIALSYACDEFESMPVNAAYRGEAQSNNCCNKEYMNRLEFCLKPCGCRKLEVELHPKTDSINGGGELGAKLKLAVFSNTEGQQAAYTALLQSVAKHKVDMAINLGNLTKSGGAKEWRKAKEKLQEITWVKDGQSCEDKDGEVCCSTQNSRKFGYLCNSWIKTLPFLSSLGEAEVGEVGMDAYFKHFGSPNASTIIGKVQIVLLDSAEATITEPQKQWLRGEILSSKDESCLIPSPQSSARTQWPMLKECTEAGKKSCSECIATEAYCITPNKERSNTGYGPQNCVCVPISAKYCKHNLYCSREDGVEGNCLCSRDGDCPVGSSCDDSGKCSPPLRLIFTYTPIFDNFGARGTAFRSREQAAELLSLFQKADVSAIFAGKILDYAQFEMANIPMYITGGGGAPLETLSKNSRHWLLISIDNAWTAPKKGDVRVEKINF
jgi:hypothetical protein